MIKEIGQYIANKTALSGAHTIFTLGGNLQIGHRPATAPDRCVVLLERVPGRQDFWLDDRVDLIVQVIARAADYHDAREDAWAAHEILKKIIAVDLPVVNSGPQYHVATSEAQQTPTYIGQDERGRFELSANYVIRIQTL